MSSGRIQAVFKGGRKALIAYITAGDPTPERTPELVVALERGGVDLIELGVPFSDPIADGPVIQRGAERALKAGTTVKRVLEIARENSAKLWNSAAVVHISESGAAIRFGGAGSRCESGGNRRLPAHRSQRGRSTELHGRHASRRARYCVSGRADVDSGAAKAGRRVFERICVSGFANRRDGRTGFDFGIAGAAGDRRCARSPSCRWRWDFGISTPEQAREVAKIADGVVVGSAIVRLIEQGGDVEAFARSLRQGMDS